MCDTATGDRGKQGLMAIEPWTIHDLRRTARSLIQPKGGYGRSPEKPKSCLAPSFPVDDITVVIDETAPQEKKGNTPDHQPEYAVADFFARETADRSVRVCWASSRACRTCAKMSAQSLALHSPIVSLQ